MAEADRTDYFRQRRAAHRDLCRRKKLCVECGAPAAVEKRFSAKTGKCVRKIVRLRCREHLEAQRAS